MNAPTTTPTPLTPYTVAAIIEAPQSLQTRAIAAVNDLQAAATEAIAAYLPGAVVLAGAHDDRLYLSIARRKPDTEAEFITTVIVHDYQDWLERLTAKARELAQTEAQYHALRQAA